MNRRRLLAWLVGLGAAAAKTVGVHARELTVTARKYSYDPSRIEVAHNDLVKITFETADIPHSFTIDAYRIAKRASAGRSVTFEFRADQPGTFPIYCNIAEDDGCRKMQGELVVR
ncbi:MAG: cupredoxin domain-containing protein [Vicinamibacterales bacterium]